MSKKLNHSRYISYGAKDSADRMYNRLRETPTAKQKAFFNSLYTKCKKNKIDIKFDYPISRSDYAHTIDLLINTLKKAGIEIKGNSKKFANVVIVGTNKYGEATMKDRLVEIEDKDEDSNII